MSDNRKTVQKKITARQINRNNRSKLGNFEKGFPKQVHEKTTHKKGNR